MVNANLSRRRFIQLAGGGLGACVYAPFSRMAWGQERLDPELIVFNAKVYTVDARQPRAEAFAVSQGRFVAVGSSADVRNLARRSTQLFDAQQMTIRDVKSRIAALERVRDGLATLIEACPGRGRAAECPILQALNDEE